MHSSEGVPVRAASCRSLQEAPAEAPTAFMGGDAIVSIIDPTGVATAAFPVIYGSDLKVL